jgi:hypothetical protein
MHVSYGNTTNLNSEAMSYNTWTLPNSVVQSKSPMKMHIPKNNLIPSRGVSFKTIAKSTVHFQIKGREWRSIAWWVDSQRDMRRGRQRVRLREVQIFLLENFVLKKNGECEREEEEGAHVRGYWRKGANLIGTLQSTMTSVGPCVLEGCQWNCFSIVYL